MAPRRPDGYDRDVKERGTRAEHWQRDRIASNPPFLVDDYGKRQVARGPCGTHYSRSVKTRENA